MLREVLLINEQPYSAKYFIKNLLTLHINPGGDICLLLIF